MTLLEFLIAVISICFIFDSATIHIINMSFIILLMIYIGSVIELFVFSKIYKKIKGMIKNERYSYN